MTIEQNPELNRFVDQSIPLTWDYRWRQLKMMLPLWIFIWVCLLEMGIWKAWLADKLSLDFFLILLGGCLFLFLFIFGMLEIQIRIRQRSKRVIQIKDDKITVRPAKNQFIWWKHISKFQLEPIPEAPGLMKLKLFGLASKMPGKAIWSMVLENPAQVQELIGCLQKRTAEVPTNYQIELLEKPHLPEHPVPFPFLGTSLYFGGLLLLFHGLPLFLIGLTNWNRHHSENDSDLSPNEKAKLVQFILKHFSSIEKLRNFYIVVGGILTLFGLLLMIWGWLLMIRKKSQIQN